VFGIKPPPKFTHVKSPSKGIYQWECFGEDVKAAFSGRNYKSSKKDAFLKQLQIPKQNLQLVSQVHGVKIVNLDATIPPPQTSADGLITSKKGVAIGILTADCIPAFFYDPYQKVIGVAHAGWRGLKAGILSQMVSLFLASFGSKIQFIQVAIGPTIRPCCYEVGPELQSVFSMFYFVPKGKSKGHVDLVGYAKEELIHCGIRPQNLFDSTICTVCQNKHFFSYRRESTKERILSLMQLS
jgi:polyphenol oxidase